MHDGPTVPSENSDENLNDSTYCGRSECLVLGQRASFADGLAKNKG
jgi:hypothetical protein